MTTAPYEAGSRLYDGLARAVLDAADAGLTVEQIEVTFEDVLAATFG